MNAIHPFYEISTDSKGKYAPKVNGHQFILTVTDQLTGYIVAVPFIDKTT